MKSIFTLLSSVMLYLLTFSTAFATLSSLPKGLYLYTGGKIGFNQQFLNKGKIQQITQPSITINGEGPSMSIGFMGGVNYFILSNFAIRGEIEYIYRIPTDITPDNVYRPTITTQIHTILTNAFFDYYVLPQLSVYAGLGIGMAVIDPSSYDSSASFAWQIGAGTAFAITKNIIIDLNLRYTDFLQYEQSLLGNKVTYPLSAVELLASVRYQF